LFEEEHMERITLQVEKRSESGKGSARAMRRAGYIPAVVYRGGKTTPIKMNLREMVNFINSTMGEQVMVKLAFSDGKSKLVLLKEYQVDPVRGELLHTDFYEVSLKEKVKVTVSIVLKGEPVGVKKEGGVIQQVLSEIEIECLPDKIPPHVELDITELNAGDTVHVSNLALAEDVKVLTEPEELIASIVVPTIEAEEEAAPPEEEEEAEEPEVVKKGKKEETTEEE
jgi:large subunit ribosomal protein L25